jgi:hypothetical protein
VNEVRWLEDKTGISYGIRYEAKNRHTDAGTLFGGEDLQAQLFRTDQGLDLVGDNLSDRARGVRSSICS